VADLKTKAKVPVDGQARIAGDTKVFTAVVVPQPAGEGKIDLDAPIEKYLPGMIRGNGNDGQKITTHTCDHRGLPGPDTIRSRTVKNPRTTSGAHSSGSVTGLSPVAASMICGASSSHWLTLTATQRRPSGVSRGPHTSRSP
jgi:hypothetical protein